MDNADMPAMPSDHTFIDGDIEHRKMFTGLTKREHFAGLAMQGFISAGMHGMPSASEIALLSISYADTLLRGLDDEQ